MTLLRRAYRPLRRAGHRTISRLRGGRGVRLRPEPGCTLAVAPVGYEDLRYWLRYEGPTFAALRRVWRSGMAVLDVGAHHGLFGLCCCPLGAEASRIVAVEPSPDAQPQLRANRAIHPQVAWSIRQVAAGDAPGHVTLHPGLVDMLVVDPSLHGKGNGAGVTVPVETLDAICAGEGIAPELVKLDVEGYEIEALRGATRLLDTRPWVFLEWHCAMLRQRGLDPLAAIEPFAARGYSFEAFEDPAAGVLDAQGAAGLGDGEIVRLLCRPPAS